MQGLVCTGWTGFDFSIGDETGIASVLTADMHMWDGCFPYPNVVSLLYACDVPHGIVIFRWGYYVSPSALQMVSAQSQVQTDPLPT